MLRLTELRLPLDHGEGELRQAVLHRLKVDDAELKSLTVFRRSYDARKKAAVVLIYTLDIELAGGPDAEAALLKSAKDSRGANSAKGANSTKGVKGVKGAAADAQLRPAPDTRYRFIGHAPADFAAAGRPRPVIVGFGPCGLFAALILAQMGLRPLVLERGRAVRERTRDTWGLWRQGVLQPESNVQFGEGGAGTFSDGKLWSQISDPRHLTRKVLNEFARAGAPEEILYVAKPHIGTFRLVSMIEKMRSEIEALGGEIRFGARVSDVLIEAAAQRGAERRVLRGLTLASGEQIHADQVVLAPGHSARDTFELLHARGVFMEAKPFSIGLRIEHPQSLIDRARFGPNAGHPILGAADYRLVHHARNGRSVYSFCMCPGGTVVAATSEPGCVVTNGMSQYSRNERNANAGIVVGISPQDYRQGAGLDAGQSAGQSARPSAGPSAGQSGGPAAGVAGSPVPTVLPLDGIAFQRFWEARAYELGGGGYRAPAQLLGDFVKGQRSSALGEVLPSYQPGVLLADFAAAGREALPAAVLAALREALLAFERQIPGFSRPDAVLTGVETRTSSPLRITRGRDYQSLNVAGLYPAGEGAGYAGGIMSAAVDGIEVAEALAARMLGLAEVGAATAPA